MNSAIWITPLLLLPGVALLVMSTSVRFAQIHGEIHDLAERAGPASEITAGRLLQRSILFRDALVGLYLSVAFLALAGLVGGVIEFLSGRAVWLVMAFTCAGIGCLLYAAIQLIRESLRAVDIIKEHVADFMEQRADKDG